MGSSRTEQLDQILADVVSRRLAGESVPDRALEQTYPDLMPELAERLHAIALVEAARAHAEIASGNGSLAANATVVSCGTHTDSSRLAALPGYESLEELHRGGQGVVYRAIQHSTQRPVAIKIMRDANLASPSERARFEREIRILGQLKHPNIVTIYDSGVYDGLAYFVMDFVPGRRLDEWAEHEDSLTSSAVSAERGESGRQARRREYTRRIVDLFAKVCDAVNVAHLRGIIHRDLKPSNIRVDPSGEPRVLDFGLAKVSEYDALDDSQAPTMTRAGQFVGTAPWASPEQAEGRTAQIDIRTDVYALGVVLYQLLCGRFPYDVSGSMRSVLDNILQAEPAPLRTIRNWIDDELQTIVLKCLQKDPERRYQAAGDLARDLRRYLAGEPIEAKRDSVAYILRKQLRRHRLSVAVGSAFLLVVFGGLIASLWAWRVAVRERDAADEARIAEARERAAADEARTIAEVNEQRAAYEAENAKMQAMIAQASNEFLTDLLAAANRGEQQGRADVQVREVLDIAARKVEDGSLRDQPRLEAAVRTTIARTYQSLGLFDEAIQHLDQSIALIESEFGRRSAECVQALNFRTALLLAVGRLAEADESSQEAIGILPSLADAERIVKSEAMNNESRVLQAFGRMQDAESPLRDAIALLEGTGLENSNHYATLLNNLGVLLSRQGRPADALDPMRRALEMRRGRLGELHPDVSMSMSSLASVLRELGRLDEAAAMYREALALRIRLLGDEHPAVATIVGNLALVLHDQGKYAEAEPYYLEAIEIREKSLGEAHPDTAAAMNNLATLYADSERPAKAEEMLRSALRIYRASFGDDHPEVATARSNLAHMILERGNATEAEELARDAIVVHNRFLGAAHPSAAGTHVTLAMALKAQGRYGEAADELRTAEQTYLNRLGPEHATVFRVRSDLGEVLRLNGQLAEAERTLYSALESGLKALGEKHPGIASTRNALGLLLLSQGKAVDAEPIFRAVLERARDIWGKQSPSVAMSMMNLGTALRLQGKLIEAEENTRAALEMHRALAGDEHPNVALATFNLAAIVGELGKVEEAEALHRRALALRRQFFGDAHPSVAQSYNSLGWLLLNAGRVDEAAPMLEQALELNRAALGPAHPEIVISLVNVATARRLAGKLDAAEEAAREGIEMGQKLLGPAHRYTGQCASILALTLDQKGSPGLAEPFHREAQRIFEGALSADHWQIAQMRFFFGMNRWLAGEKDEAIQLLSSAANDLVDNPNAPLKRKCDAIEALLRVLDEQEDEEGVRAWSARLSELRDAMADVHP